MFDTCDRILKIIKATQGLTLNDLRSKDMRKHVREARILAAWLLRRHTQMSLPTIGELLNRDHASILRSVRACEALQLRNKEFSNLCTFVDGEAKLVLKDERARGRRIYGLAS